MNKLYLTPVFVFVFLLVIASVSGFAISSPYWKDNPLKIAPGEKIDIQLVLNNGGGATERAEIKCVVSEGADIARLTDSGDYTIAAGGTANSNLQVSIDDATALGTTKTIRVSCNPQPPANTSAPVGIGQAVEQVIPVIVAEKEAPAAPAKNNTLLYVVIGALVILVIVFFVLRKKK